MAHVLVAWELSGSTPERNTELRKALLAQFEGYRWVRVVKSVYVVKVGSIEERTMLKTRLVDVAKSEGEIHFIMTPMMVGGTYGGWLPKRKWPKIRERTTDDG